MGGTVTSAGPGGVTAATGGSSSGTGGGSLGTTSTLGGSTSGVGGGTSGVGGSTNGVGGSTNGVGGSTSGIGGSTSGAGGMLVGGTGGTLVGAGGTAGGGGVTAGGGSGGMPAVDSSETLAIMRRVADYELARFGSSTNNDWVRAVFHTGLLALYRVTQESRYLEATRSWGEANGWGLGPDSNGDPRFADNDTCIQSYAELYLMDPVQENEVMLSSARKVFDQMVAMPRPGRDEWWWCDSLFMAPPAMVRVALATGKTEYIDLMHSMWWDTHAYLYDKTRHLFWRDDSFRNTSFWSRGNGWVVAGTARVLEFLPADDPRRGDYENLLREMADTLRTAQGEDGFWRSNLLEPNEFPNPESSGTAFFCFGIAWGIHHGVLDRATYLGTVTRAWEALTSAVSPQGRLGWVQAVGAKPGPATEDSTNDYASGAFLLAGTELLEL